MDKRYQLVFRGELRPGFDGAAVRHQVGEQLKLDDARLKHLFSGQRVVLKRDVDEERAHRYVRQFAQMGAVLHLEGVAGAAAAVPARPAAAPLTAPLTAPTTAPTTAPPVAPAPPGTPGPTGLAPLAAPAAALTLAPAEETITCPHCGKVQPKTVFCSECSTNMPMGIAARKEAESAARAAPAATMLRMETGRGLAEQAPRVLGLRMKGRLSKRGYAMGLAGTFLVGWLLVLFVARSPGLGRLFVAGLAGLVVGWFYLRLCVLRFHDINRSGWWAAALAVPILGFIAALVLALVPSTDGDNDYGEMPDEGSRLVTSLVTGGCALLIAWLVKPALEQADHEERRAIAEAAAAPPPLDAAAERALHVEYAAEPGHKAFAATAGAFGWKSNAETGEDAEEAALAQCEGRRPVGAPACELVDLNGQPVPRQRRY